MTTHLHILTLVIFVLGKGRPHEAWGCGDEWSVFGAHCYRVGGVRATHTHATTSCRAHASHLVSVHSTGENNFLLSLLEGADEVWLGLVAEEEEEKEDGEWSWIARLLRETSWRWTDGSPLTYTSWESSQRLPDSSPSCVSLQTRTSLWLPTPCHHLLEFVCKKTCHRCNQPRPPAAILDPDGSGSGDIVNTWAPRPSRWRHPGSPPLEAPDSEASEEINATLHSATRPACEGACGRTFYRLSMTSKAWRGAWEDCKAGGGRVAVVVNRVPTKLARRLTKLGKLLWVGSRALDSTLTLPKPGAIRSSTTPCRVAIPGSGRSTTVSCLRRHRYLCEYSHVQNDRPTSPASALAVPTTPRPPCPPGWHISGGRCYRAFSAWTTWVAAEETCTSHGGHLVSVSGPSEQRALRRLSLERVMTSPVWVGLRRTEGADEGFEWVDGTPFDTRGWERGQPDHHQGREWCGAASLPGFDLQDAVCLTLMPFVCEADSGDILGNHGGMFGNTLPPPTASSPSDELCEGDPGWLLHGDHCYRLVGAEDMQPWWKSNQRCLEEGARLASVHTLEENYWLQAKMVRLKANAVWLGGRLQEEGYSWLDHTPFNFTNWAPGEPNNVHDQEDCLALYTRRQGYWNDQNCGTPAGRVCKRPLGSSTSAFTSAATPTATPGHCSHGWTTAPGGKCYKYFSELKDLDTARAACRRANPAADLASVHTEAQQAYLTVMAGEGETGAWLGMKKQQGDFLWVDQTPVTYTSWAAGEPSDAKAPLLPGRRRHLTEECVELLTHSRAGLWNDVACSERRAFLCQAPVEAEPRLPSPPRAAPSCAPPHNHYQKRGDHCYRHVLNPLPWQEAEDTCAGEEAHLATALTRTEAAAVWVAAMEAGIEEAWLGLHHQDERGAFRWSSGWPLLHAPWSSDTNTSGSGGMCGALNSSSGQWVARPCIITRPFICHLAKGTGLPGAAVKALRGSCPDGRWLDFGGVSCYLVVREPKPWHDARYTCLLEGGDLTSIASAGEMTLLTAALHDVTQAVWIGLVREENGQRWTDGLRLSFTNWNEGEPNGEAGLCTEVYTGSGRWNDVECSQVRPFVCKHLRT